MKIKFFYDDVNYQLRKVRSVKSLIIKVIREEKRIPGDLNFIFTGDERIIEINREFMKHDNFTDVIAFDYCERKTVNGEIYISLDTVKRNANNYKVSLRSEIIRVIIHGTLHLCGYRDKKKEERKIMKEMEDQWLMRFYSE